MRVAIAGAGPTGLFLGVALTRRGHDVTVVERDDGPAGDVAWPRRGVMQFRYAHAFRFQVGDALKAEMPEAYQRWVDLGAEEIRAPNAPAGAPALGMRSQRVTFERALRGVAASEPGLRLRRGRVTGVRRTDGVATGLRVDGGDDVAADLVLDATGRSGTVASDLPERGGFGGSCGIAYVDRKYRLHPGAEPGPMSGPVVMQRDCDGYQVLVFPHERGLFSAVIIRPASDPDLKHLRHDAAYDAATRAIPGLAEWTDPERSSPLTPVLPGGTLRNHYRSQRGLDGRRPLDGLIWVGDAVATTTPTFGRGITLALQQARGLLTAVDEHGTDVDAVAETFGAFCDTRIRPWVQDHVEVDTGLADRWCGRPTDLDERLPSDLVLDAAEVDPSIMDAGMAYLTMTAGPDVLDVARPAARAVLATGWRRPLDPGPSRAELGRLVLAAR